MRNKLLILATVALALAACAKQQDIPVEETQPMAVGFDAYLNRAVTKSTTLNGLKGTETIPGGSGFGIFAYYTDNDNYDGNSIPNFMYNEKVTWNSSKWDYSPIKYWPNEYGDSAQAEEYDRISFFAYAPYTLDNGSGKAGTESSAPAVFSANSKGIVGFTKNNYAGDPLVKYVVDLNPATSVDLVWGCQPTFTTSGTSPYEFDPYTGSYNNVAGMPWLDVRRPKYSTNETVRFQFNHALAQLNVTVDAIVDGTTASIALDGLSRIWIRSVTFTGFATEGTLNLNNVEASKALWQSINGDDLVTGEEVTIYDGRKDGREGTTSASNEKYTGLNDQLYQAETYTAVENPLSLTTLKTGVTHTAQNLFKSVTAATPIYVIPTGDQVTVTIAYDVETYDPNLATFLSDGSTHGSSISNVITKSIPAVAPATIFKFENGKSYTLALHLGMNSVKVDADVTDWGSGADEDVYLPTN